VGDFQVQMAKIAADLQGKAIEAQVKLDIAELEANAQIATSIIEGLAKTYGDNLGLIGSLAGELSESMDLPKDAYIRGLMDAAEKRVQDLHNQQMKVTEAQIAYLTAKAQQAASGSPLITIQGDGLEPQLEAFMWQIIKNIQVKASMEGADFLLGGCAA
jgi:hypothetical protein